MAGMNVNWQWRGLNFNPELKGQLQRGIEEGGLDAFVKGFNAMRDKSSRDELAELFVKQGELQNEGDKNLSSMSDEEIEAEIKALKSELGMDVQWL